MPADGKNTKFRGIFRQMKSNLLKIIICFVVIAALIKIPAPTLAQEYLEQASEADLKELDNLLDSAAETAFQTSLSASGNDFNVDLVWKTYTLLPYDYPGKALPIPYSLITLHALPDFPNPERLIYRWLVDDISSSRQGPELQGRGKDTFNLTTFQIPRFTHELRVIVQNEDATKTAQTSFKLQTVMPETYFYLENNNNHNNLVFDSLTFLPGTETSLLVRPFYFNLSSWDGLEFLWRFGGKEQENTNTRKDILPLNIPRGGLKGASGNLRLELVNTKQKNNYYDRASVGTEIKIAR